MEQKTLKVTGMSCEHCVKAVTSAISSLPGVSNVTVSLKDGTAAFDFDPALTPLKNIEAAVTEEGYEVS
jgi:copper ion binding protein